MEFNDAIASFAREVADIGELLLGEPERTHLLRPQFQNGLGRNLASSFRLQTIENGLSGFAVELLKHDGTNERSERRLAILHRVRTDALDDGSEHRIATSQVGERCFRRAVQHRSNRPRGGWLFL